MGKDSALGHDPLRWMKITKENNKSLSPEDASAKGRNAETIEQQPGIQSAPKQQIPIPSGNGEVRLVSKKVTPSPGSGDMPGNPAATKPKVVIGRLYEKPSPEKAKSVQRNEMRFRRQGVLSNRHSLHPGRYSPLKEWRQK